MAAHTVSIDEAKTQLSDLIATAQEGGEIIIVDNGKALARLVSAADSAVYQTHAVTPAEFATDDEEPLAWEADGWESVA
jgi:prevent-host-death family protein